MAEKHWKMRIRRIFRSCKSENCVSTYDVLDTHTSTANQDYLIDKPLDDYHHHHNTISIISPNYSTKNSPFTNTFIINNPTYLSPQLQGHKCPPVSPIISPLNLNAALYNLHRSNEPTTKTTKTYKSHSMRYNRGGFDFENNFRAEEEKQQRTALVSGGGRRLSRSSSMSRETTTRRKSNAEDEMKKSLAVVKRSSDPYGDFRASMVEMIVQNQIFAAKDLQELLRCFLSLNSSHYHSVILQVFDEISQSLLHYHHHGQNRK